jgi:hypothetical protein
VATELRKPGSANSQFRVKTKASSAGTAENSTHFVPEIAPLAVSGAPSLF